MSWEYIAKQRRIESADRLFEVVSLFCAKADKGVALTREEDKVITLISDNMAILAGKTFIDNTPAAIRCSFLLANQTHIRQLFDTMTVPNNSPFTAEELQQINDTQSSQRLTVTNAILRAKNVAVSQPGIILLLGAASLYTLYANDSIIAGLYAFVQQFVWPYAQTALSWIWKFPIRNFAANISVVLIGLGITMRAKQALR